MKKNNMQPAKADEHGDLLPGIGLKTKQLLKISNSLIFLSEDVSKVFQPIYHRQKSSLHGWCGAWAPFRSAQLFSAMIFFSTLRC